MSFTCRLSCLLLILWPAAIFAQPRKTVTYQDLPPGGISLSDGWVYRAGDEKGYADPDLDDSGWAPLNPSMAVREISVLKSGAVGWLRYKFSVGAKLDDQPLVLDAWHNCATEVYLDGKLFMKRGTISADPGNVVPLGMNQKAVLFRVRSGQVHVIAVRFAAWQGAAFLRNGAYLLSMSLGNFAAYQDNQAMIFQSGVIYIVFTAIFFLLSLFHLSFYRYDPQRRANIFFAVYALVSALSFLMVCLQGYVQDMRAYALVYTPAFVLDLMGGIWITNALGSLFRFKVKVWLAGMWLIYAAVVLQMVFWGINNAIFFGTIALFTLVQFGLAIRGLIAARRGAAIIASGLFTGIFAGIGIVVISANDALFSYWRLNLFEFLAVLSPAVGISVYLAREFALDSGLLRSKLVEVQNLSEQSLAYEREKQELMASQKHMLEREVKERTAELTRSLEHLQQTQQQLIQSEKMASLGELTAGIAHEIQNPLNFVNNFSEVSADMIDELTDELAKGDITEAEAIAKDIRENLTKIHHHGKRADGIVKGMLEHSRISSGQREQADLNKLTVEYLNLAYQGIRAKDRTFQAELVTRYDKALPPVSIMPQEIGRALLNIFNNAFYAVNQKRLSAPGNFKPVVEVVTGKRDNTVFVVVRDNGTGIPEQLKSKIMQPFFTTKPAGSGTGLGLSLTYDIVVKGHGGNLEMESREHESTVFTLLLPIK